MLKKKKKGKIDLTFNGRKVSPESARPDWTRHCLSCGSSPILPITDLCGPCTFGEADMTGGGWWDEDDELDATDADIRRK